MRVPATIAIAALLVGCGSAHSSERRDDGPKSTRSFNLSGFERVALKGSDDVRVVAGPAFAVTATGSDHVLERLDIRVEDGTLVVSRKRRSDWSMGWSHDKGALVTVTMPLIRGASLAGSGDLNVETTADDKFEGDLAGSGDLTVENINAAETEFSLAGSGDVRAKGTTKRLALSIAGSGGIDASALTSETAQVSIAGSGDISLRASQSVDGSIIGSGDVRVDGTRNCTVSKLGSGDVICG